MIAENLNHVLDKVSESAKKSGRTSEDVFIVGVSKFKTAEAVEEASRAGLKHVGENYWQEAESKIKQLAHLPLVWHFIGHLQSNKARSVVGLFEWVHSVDRFRVAKALSVAAQEKGEVQKILLQINIGDEATKSGVSELEAPELILQVQALPHLQIDGLMVMPPLANETQDSRKYFSRLKSLSSKWEKFLSPPHTFRHLSMGTSHDYTLAVEEGATMIRIGTQIFGSRKKEV